MMRRTGLIAAGIAMTTATLATAAPPRRPAPLTPAQYAELRRVEAQPRHVAVLDVRASYGSEHEEHMDSVRMSDDILTGAYQIGMPSAILAILIAAAPL